MIGKNDIIDIPYTNIICFSLNRIPFCFSLQWIKWYCFSKQFLIFYYNSREIDAVQGNGIMINNAMSGRFVFTSSSLTIMNATKEDSGIYTCRPENDSKNNTATTTLVVFQKQDTIVFQIRGYNNPSENELCHDTSQHKFQVRHSSLTLNILTRRLSFQINQVSNAIL